MQNLNFTLLLALLLQGLVFGSAFVSVARSNPPDSLSQRRYLLYSSVQTNAQTQGEKKYQECFKVIDSCASSGQSCDELYESVRYIDKSALKLYPDLDAKKDLWRRAHGSWKLQLATGGGKFQTFKPIPIFAFAMIDTHNFGNGVGFNEDKIILSLLGPHYFNEKRRQMGIGISDMYLFSSKVTQFVPDFIADGMGLGKTPDEFKQKGGRMPAFTMIGASERSLVARGGSGGIAIWTRLENDIRPAAYGKANVIGSD